MSKWKPSAGDETSNSHARREREGYFEKYFVGKGIDIGCGHTTITPDARGWDIARGDGDATHMAGVPDGEFDFCYASHVLEHLDEPMEALRNWWRILKLGGYLVVAVPDAELYEQGVWPSIFNADHRTAWHASKDSLEEHERSLAHMIGQLDNHRLISLRVCDEGYDHTLGLQDQPQAERQVEAVVQKVEGPSWRASVASGVQCACGSTRLVLLGFQVTGKALCECLRCGQRSVLDVRSVLTQLDGRK